MNRLHAFLASLTVSLFTSLPIADAQQKPAPVEVPKSSDPRLIVELVAAQPDIVQPINIAFDSKGRLLVIESHTHFRPPGYKGPPADRIRVIEPVPGKSKADHVGTFFEGTKHTMDIAVRFDGSIYLATRNEILRLTDTRGDGKAITKQRIAFLDTKGDYPHDGLCGLCFDSQGNLFFGLGENLGYAYKLIGADGTTLAGEGDGGHIFWCTADGNKLAASPPASGTRSAFAWTSTANCSVPTTIPTPMPPCRLVHVVEGGDYGFHSATAARAAIPSRPGTARSGYDRSKCDCVQGEATRCGQSDPN